MGPGEASAFSGDDTNANAVPRYLQNVSPSDPSRGIIKDPFSGAPTPFFTIKPTRTQLLYSFVTNLVGWQTGIQVSNAGKDDGVFGNTGQAGALDFYFFPTANPTFHFTPTNGGIGRGLDGNGLLQPGSDFAATLDQLLTASGHANLVGNFDGYVIVVCHFNFAHGAGFVFNSSGASSGFAALVLGGDSARRGNIQTLPERLSQ
jgi:hypothetical protein